MVRTAAFLIVFTFILWFLTVAKVILVPIAFAALFSVMLYPLCQFFERNGFPRIIAIVLSMLFVFVILTGVVILLSSQVYNFVNNLPHIADKLENTLSGIEWFLYKNFDIELGATSEIWKNSISKFFDSGVFIISGTIKTGLGLLNIFGLIPIYIFLFLLYRNAFSDFFLQMTPIEKHRTVSRILIQIQKVVQSYIVGLVTVMSIVGVLNSASLFIMGIDYALFFGFLAAMLTIIPYIGIFIGSLLPALYALLTMDSPWYALAVILAFGFVQFLEGNFITPRITGSKVKINALAAILALLTGGVIWGAAGLIIFLPLIAVIKVIFDNVAPLKPYGILLGTEISETKSSMGGYFNGKNFRVSGYKPKRKAKK